MTAINRAALGFLAAALSVLTFHQVMFGVLHLAGLVGVAPWRITPVPPFGVPWILDLCFWGGVYGAVFGLALPRLPRLPLWLLGLGLGVLAALVAMFVVAPLKGLPVHITPMRVVISLLINGFWGIGVGIILPLLRPKAALQAS